MDLEKNHIYGFLLEELETEFKRENIPSYRAKQALHWIYTQHITSWSQAANLPEDVKTFLEKNFPISLLQFSEKTGSGNQESNKYLFRTCDGRLLESVLISQRGRRTVCVSTQLGCKMGCVFCASGKGKFGRNLTAGEIIEQVATIERDIGEKISNIVYMGMGEPLDNFEATMKTLKILQAPWAFALGARRITVSTSGITPKILEFVEQCEGKVRLSVSLHSSIEKTRSEIVPINRKYSLKELEETLVKIHETLRRDITFEYTLIEGVNDSREEAMGVARLSKLIDAKINLIPYNPIREMDYKTPSQENINQFKDTLHKNGVRVLVRQTAGRDINAACGQLRLDREEHPAQ